VLIGKGSYGTVYGCTLADDKSCINCAIKVIEPDLNRGAAGLEDWLNSLREVAILIDFRGTRGRGHEHVSRLIDIVVGASGDMGAGSDTVAVALIFHRYTASLARALDAGRQSPEHLRVRIQQLLSAVDFCHRLGIVHGDLKPDNILEGRCSDVVSAPGTEIALCDWGLAQFAGETRVIASMSYRPPEVYYKWPNRPAVDLASVALIIVLLVRSAYTSADIGDCAAMPLKTNSHPISEYIKLIGIETEADRDYIVRALEAYKRIDKSPHLGTYTASIRTQPLMPSVLRAEIEALSGSAALADLVMRLAAHDPEKRLSAGAALSHEYFSEKGASDRDSPLRCDSPPAIAAADVLPAAVAMPVLPAAVAMPVLTQFNAWVAAHDKTDLTVEFLSSLAQRLDYIFASKIRLPDVPM
jgi:serine/threonine protein kinase